MKRWQKMAVCAGIIIGAVARYMGIGFLLSKAYEKGPEYYHNGLCYLNEYVNENSRKIANESELIKLLDEKKRKYNFNKEISVVIDSTGEIGTESAKYGNISYEITLELEDMSEGMLEHELYHIIDGHLENRTIPLIDYIQYEYYNEPKTIIHTLLELKK
jgi:hypothetical protein